MKIVEINMLSIGSTGKIMLNIAQEARKNGHEVVTYSTNVFLKKFRKLPPAPYGHKYFGTYFENGIHYCLGQFFSGNGFFGKFSTLRLISQLKKFKPDIIHIHNLHSYCFNFPSFIKYVNKNNIRVFWTLHDCWAFTGQCPHFDMVGCKKWKTGCHDCSQKNGYPRMRVDNSKRNYERKKYWFTSIKNLTIVTPSNWLAGLVKQSFLKDYPIKVINNGIDLSVFKPTQSEFREKYSIENKFILLGVAFGWGGRKGLDVFIELSKRLSDDFQIVLVGTDDNVDSKLPKNIISIHRTQNQSELAEIYSSADLFVNPTREEVLGLVNIESLACGTPVITFRTGGSPEVIDETCGCVVDKNDVDAMEKEIIRIKEEKPYSEEACLARAKKFDMENKFAEYVKLYES